MKTLKLEQNRIVLNDESIDALSLKPGDRVSIQYLPQEDIMIPIVGKFTDGDGNLFTKSKSFSYRGQQNSILRKYGVEFKLEEHINGQFKLISINN